MGQNLTQVGETKEVVIWAFPSQAQAYSDTLVASLKDNPTPYNFNLSAVGVLPCVQLTGEWFQKAIQLRALAETLPDAPPEPVVEVGRNGSFKIIHFYRKDNLPFAT